MAQVLSSEVLRPESQLDPSIQVGDDNPEADGSQVPDFSDVIIPPPDIRSLIEKTSSYVGQYGPAFEATILAKKQNDRKFDFLHPDNAYHAYYKQKLYLLLLPEEERRLAEEGLANRDDRETADDMDTQVSAPVAPVVKPTPLTFRQRLKIAIARSSQPLVTPTSPPADDLCVSMLPPYPIAAVDLEIIRLTARFVSINGRAFLSALQTRESRNPQFEFLRPSNPCFAMFQRLCDAYDQVISSNKPRYSQCSREGSDSTVIMEEILGRIEFARIQLKLSGERQEEDEQERLAMQLIDWHSFVVLRTIQFDGDETEYLPAPMYTIEEINRMLDAQEELAAGAAAERRIADDVEMEMDEEEQPSAQAEQAEEEAPMIIVDRAAANSALVAHQRQQDASVKFQTCPSCKELIRDTEMSDHIRICLLDPRWKQQKEASMQKQRESNLIDGTDISRHLTELARRRQDIFTSTRPASQPSQPLAASQSVPCHEVRDDGDTLRAAAIAKAQQDAMRPAPMSALAPPMPRYVPPPVANLPPVGGPMYALPPQNMQGFSHTPHHMAYQPPPPMPAPAFFPPPPASTSAAIPPPPPATQPPHPSQTFHPPPPPPSQPEPKRPRVQPPPPPASIPIISEAEFIATHPEPVDVFVQISNNPDWNLTEQNMKISLKVQAKTIQIKQALSKLLADLAPKKMKLQLSDGRWLKDNDTLAFYNIASGTKLQFDVKERGRKK